MNKYKLTRKKITGILVGGGIIASTIVVRNNYEDFLEYEADIHYQLENMELFNHTIIAHRGHASIKPENSIEAIRSAVNDQVIDYVEIDINRTKDGIFILNHDERIAGAVIRYTTYDELKEIREATPFRRSTEISLRNQFLHNPEYNLIHHRTLQLNGKDVSLANVMDIINYQQEKPFLIDLKGYCDPEVFAYEFAPITDLFDNENNIYQSFDHELLQKLHELRPELNLSILVRNQQQLERYRDYYDMIGLRHNLATEEVLMRELSDNKRLFIWTMNNFQDVERVVRNSNGRQKELSFITKIPDALAVHLAQLDILYPPVESSTKTKRIND